MRWKLCRGRSLDRHQRWPMVAAQEPERRRPAQSAAAQPDPNIKAMVDRLDLEKFKATIKGLTQFGDRRQGTDRNRRRSTGLKRSSRATAARTPSASLTPTHPPAASDPNAPARGAGAGAAAAADAGVAARQDQQDRRQAATRAAGARAAVRSSAPARRTGVYQPDAPNAAPLDPRLQALNAQPTTPGERQDVYCTKIGTTHPEEMYIIGGHMDGHGWGEAANDDGSGTALVMEARTRLQRA